MSRYFIDIETLEDIEMMNLEPGPKREMIRMESVSFEAIVDIAMNWATRVVKEALNEKRRND